MVFLFAPNWGVSAMLTKHVGCLSATAALATLISFTSANATSVVFSDPGGTAGTLGNLFNGFSWAIGAGSGIDQTTPVQIYGNGSAGGLEVSPDSVTLTFTFEGASAAYTNLSQTTFTFGNDPASQLDNQTDTPVTKTYTANYNVGPNNPGLVPFTFESLCGSTPSCGTPSVHFATNGGFIDPNVEMAIALVGTSTAYIFLEDIAIGGDSDFNDMIVRVDGVVGPGSQVGPPGAAPIPAALPLFATGLGAMGLFGWRRKRKNTSVLAAA